MIGESEFKSAKAVKEFFVMCANSVFDNEFANGLGIIFVVVLIIEFDPVDFGIDADASFEPVFHPAHFVHLIR